MVDTIDMHAARALEELDLARAARSPGARQAHLALNSSEARQIIVSIRTLRTTIVEAWQARGVILTEDERRILRDEIRDTCDLLTDLTAE